MSVPPHSACWSARSCRYQNTSAAQSFVTMSQWRYHVPLHVISLSPKPQWSHRKHACLALSTNHWKSSASGRLTSSSRVLPPLPADFPERGDRVVVGVAPVQRPRIVALDGGA